MTNLVTTKNCQELSGLTSNTNPGKVICKLDLDLIIGEREGGKEGERERERERD